jgi:hypothetical protein
LHRLNLDAKIPIVAFDNDPETLDWIERDAITATITLGWRHREISLFVPPRPPFFMVSQRYTIWMPRRSRRTKT